MIVLRCPYCLELRCEPELEYGGEATVVRPQDPEKSSDSEWTEYLFTRENIRGAMVEYWCCRSGCSQWFKVARHTASHEILGVSRCDAPLSATGTS